MQVFEQVPPMMNWLEQQRIAGHSIGFVPTMGALHEGHLSLVRNAINGNDIAVASIFVNPTQFNDASDLVAYPRQVPADLAMLETAGCHAVLVPEVRDMYPNGTEASGRNYTFGSLELVMEGAMRPGHFEGVAQIVSRLFDIVQPDAAYFGEKDYQQLQIINALNEQGNYGINVVGCPIIRENDGLAMSSRNQRLNAEQRAVAPHLYNCLRQARLWAGTLSVDEVRHLISGAVAEHGDFELDYFELADARTLQLASDWDSGAGVRAFVAAFLGDVRLIDNMAM